MFFLLPDAERFRRLALTGLLLLVLTVLALVPWDLPDRWLGRGTSALAAPLAGLAGLAVDAVAGRPEAVPLLVPPLELEVLERQLGTPEPVAGLRWLETPVLEADLAAGELHLAGGRRHGLAPGSPVVFGRLWLGRVAEAGEVSCRALLWTAADARTGVLLEDAEGRLAAVCVGRGRDAPPLVRWVETAGEPRPGMTVRWRRREADPPELASLDLELGVLRQEGDPRRRQERWVVEARLPLGAEGRVWVGAGALGPEPPPRLPLRRRTAEPLLRADAVLGPRLALVRSPGAGGALATPAGVAGPVVAGRGELHWIRHRAPLEWGEEALAVDPASGVLEPVSALDAQARMRAFLYTRGTAGVPRGLPLGPARAGPPLIRGPLELVSRAPFPEEDAR